MHKQYLSIIAGILLFCNISFGQTSPKRELRAVWISTVFNTDFPSKPGLSGNAQKLEIINLLNFHQRNGMNAVIFQVRPAADAFYNSKYEPWSKWLTGKLGNAPQPYYDPLAYFIDEAHKRDMEFHAWFNPYRAWMDTTTTPDDSMHVIKQHPEWFVTYGNRRYFDPGIPAVRSWVVKVVMDVVQHYNVDAIQFDDYFYPYKIADADFPDNNSYILYNNGFTNKADWRRNNVDMVIQLLHDSIKAAKPWVKFGISPFGIYKNQSTDSDGSATNGMSNYYDLYADILKWLRNDWIDYVAPQLYWHIGNKNADYQVLVDWWSKHLYGKHLYIGHAVYQADSTAKVADWRSPSQLPKQFRINRKNPQVRGSVFFSSASFAKNPLGFNDSLRYNFYNKPAFLPEMKWKDNVPPEPPDVHASKFESNILLSWKNQDEAKFPNDTAVFWVVYKFKGKVAGSIDDVANIYKVVKKPYIVLPRKRWEFFREKYTFVVTAFDRLQNESKLSNLVIVKLKE